ncbi:MAG: LysR family transcriptional regulator [Beijerinckiaceae bacterium]
MDDIHAVLAGVASVLAVAREGSFRKASKAFSISFRTLQSNIESFESKLGFPLFHRTVEGMKLTPEGMQVLHHARQIEEQLAMLGKLAKSSNDQSEGDVMVATTEGLGTFWLSPRLAEFALLHPKISINLFPSMQVADMRRFEVDIALQVVEPVNPEIKRVKVGMLHLILAASPEYIARHGKPKSLSELAEHAFVFHTNPQFSDRLMIENAVGRKLPQTQYVVMRNSSAHYMTIQHGLGIGFIPSYGFAIGTRLEPIALPIRHSLDIWLCFNSDARSIPRVADAIDWIGSLFDQRLYPWFRREYVAPSKFEAIVNANGIGSLMQELRLHR